MNDENRQKLDEYFDEYYWMRRIETEILKFDNIEEAKKWVITEVDERRAFIEEFIKAVSDIQ